MRSTRGLAVWISAASLFVLGAEYGIGQGASPPAAAAKGVAMPDTPAGRCATDFLRLFSAAPDADIAAFEAAWASPRRQARGPVAERMKTIERLHGDFGDVEAKEVLCAAADEISVLVGRSKGTDLTLEFVFEPGATVKLDMILISEGANRPEPLTAERRSSTVDSVAASLAENYVFPEIASKMSAAIRDKLAAGGYDQIRSESAFARLLTEDLRAISHDLHLGVRVLPEREGPDSRPHGQGAGSDNSGFRSVELLEGNVGCVRLDSFQAGPEAEKTAAAALAFLANADALIFDLRSNGGGHPAMVRFISSFLFAKRTHLNDMVDRLGDVTEEYWTLDEVPGRRFKDDLPVFVLTSSRTFSGAEEFAYNLKALKRATIVGERTGGGAHPTAMDRLNERFVLSVPFMRAQNPITKTNWEQKGVEPDVAVPADAARTRAISEARAALEKLRR